VAPAQRAVPRSAASSAGCTTALVGAGARAAAGYAHFPAAHSPAPKPRENAAQRRRTCGAAVVAGRAAAAAPAAATKRRGFAAQVTVAAAAACTAATPLQRLSHKARMPGKALLPDTCRCKTA